MLERLNFDVLMAGGRQTLGASVPLSSNWQYFPNNVAIVESTSTGTDVLDESASSREVVIRFLRGELIPRYNIVN